MIRKIKKIKNLGIFKSYTSDGVPLPEFEKYNLFYGCNGSGKTTITKLFDSFNSGENPEYPDLEYEFEHGTEVDSNNLQQGKKYQTKIRVFNKKYVEDNIEILEGKAKPIFILGAENKKLSEQIKEDDEKLKGLEKDNTKLEEDKLSKETERGKNFTDVARTIGAISGGDAKRNYTKREAENDFKKLTAKKILEAEKVHEYQTTLKQEQKTNLLLLGFIFDLDDQYDQVSKILKKTVESEILLRLKENPDISEWVEKGVELQKLHKNIKCEFCDNSISEARLKDLSTHFNEADKNLKKEIDEIINGLKKNISDLENLTGYDKDLLYTELTGKYDFKLTIFNQEKKKLSIDISALIEKLKDKKTKTTEEIYFANGLNNNFSSSLNLLNEIIKEHNNKTDSFETKKNEASQNLKNHYLSEIYDDVKKIGNEIENCTKTIANIKKEIDGEDEILGLKAQIRKNKSTISSEHKACDDLNKNLVTFLGRKEIIFEVDSGGYLIKRNGEIAENLSEGEKTAIAFIYFIVHLEDQDFNIQDGIIVIDDPVSSLDSNSTYQVVSFITTSVGRAKQVFLFTHNFDFLRLLVSWASQRSKKNKRDKSCFMINNICLENERTAAIDKIDPLLTNYESEYHYLCKQLFDFNDNSKEDKSIEDVYHIPNIGRKVLETFLMFRIPKSKSIYGKIQFLGEKTSFDKNKLTALYKFFNNQSHMTGSGFDPSLVQEAEKNVKYLLDMIKDVSPKHYEILEEELRKSKN